MEKRVLFATSNGAGLGHLTRSMAVARRLDPSVQPVVFTLSQAAPLVRELGYHTEFLFSPGYGGTSRREWNVLFERRVRHILDTYDPAVVMFDGTYPYLGLLTAARQDPARTFVWCRRAMWRSGLGERNLDASSDFDHVLEPGELAAAYDQGATVSHRMDAYLVPPLVYCDEEELPPREEAAAELGLDPDETNVLLQLGAGNINDITSLSGMVVERLLKEPRTSITLPVSPIAADDLDLADGVHTVSRYPLSRYFRAFDVCVSASGYNSFHEQVRFALPSIFIPNLETSLDDQLARARWAHDQGAGLTVIEPARESLDDAITTMMDPDVREQIAQRCRELSFENGASKTAEWIEELVGTGSSDREED